MSKTTLLNGKGREEFAGLDQGSAKYYGSRDNYYYSQGKLKTQPKSVRPSEGVAEVLKKGLDIRCIGTGLIVVCLIFYLHGAWISSAEKKQVATSKLLMVNVFIRHGDRKLTTNYAELFCQKQRETN